MNTRKAIKKILFVTVWLIIGSGMVILLAAAMRKQKNDRCRDWTIRIRENRNYTASGCCAFMDQNDIQQLLITASHGSIKGQPVSSVNLHQLELVLEENPWIKDAELYFDNNDVLHIVITEREAVARIFTTENHSFYIDSMGYRMPLSDKISVVVPVFTGFPEKKVLPAPDSLLLSDVKSISQFILNDPFWMAQVAQVDITAERKFEIAPAVGDHLVHLGNGEQVAAKFHRLFVFYKEVLGKTGFDKYKEVDVQYAGQVIALQQTKKSRIDSAQLRRNVEKILQESLNFPLDSMGVTKPAGEENTAISDSAAVRKPITVKPVHADGRKRKLPVQHSLPGKPKAVMTAQKE